MFPTNRTISTYRQATVSGDKTTFSGTATLEDVAVDIQRTSTEVAILLDDTSGVHTFSMYMDGTPDIKIGDKVTDDNSTDYIVKGVKTFSGYTDSDDHTEVTMTEKYNG